MKKIDTRLIALAFFFVAILVRFLPHPHNFTPVAAMALFAGCYLSGGVGIVLAIGAMAISDFVGHQLGLGGIQFYSTGTMLTVYCALALTGLVGRVLRNRVSRVSVPVASVAGTAIFFLLTNFACWLDPMMGYAQTASGLATCYWRAIPFSLNSLLGDLFFSSAMFGGYAYMLRAQSAQAPSSVSTK